MTHEMFACDAPSACWVDAVTNSRSCRSSLQPLPPSFTCTTGQYDVPYTLVCDHRPDCKDSSDESFCDFPSCDPITQFDCGNGEVRSPLVLLGLCQSVCPSACMSTVHLRVQISIHFLACTSACPSVLFSCLQSIYLPCYLSVLIVFVYTWQCS